ncbi:UDP-N-acetylmuramate dehydrogenase [Shewanella ulleungensis]|nr:UDP-N-acetylmuramate dehydrogenase [Shewanella ulleungensis]MCL1152406.1 UDP-N-acetylmuramate dehydrogenase [Shewanella ulleungensis]
MLTSLAPLNTFGLQQYCSSLVRVVSKSELIDVCTDLYSKQLPMLILGGGSNLVFTTDYRGTVVNIATKGITMAMDTDYYYVSVQAGENWHDLVEFCLANQINGLENMALIPGTVGAAPIQNIGAYGVEFNRFCHAIEFLRLDSNDLQVFSNEQCHFSYRESIFKQELKNLAVVTEVTLKLPKQWQPVLDYGPLQNMDPQTVTAKQIFDCVCQVRQSKLPDPKVLGNVGSFFKNPIVTCNEFIELRVEFPTIVAYEQVDGQYKLAAGWLIEQAGLKGFRLGDAAVHQNQALVLVNMGSATGEEVCQLARHIIDVVFNKFAVTLQPEPRIIGPDGEIKI